MFRHRKLLGSDLVSSYSTAPEALELDLQTSNHQVHRRGTRLPPGQPNSRLSKIHWRTLRDFPARASPDPSPVRHSKFLTAGQALTPRKIICHRTATNDAIAGVTVALQHLRAGDDSRARVDPVHRWLQTLWPGGRSPGTWRRPRPRSPWRTVVSLRSRRDTQPSV